MRSRPSAFVATRLLPLAFIATLFMGCRHTAPQRPIRLGKTRTDSTLLRMMALNEHLSEQADRAVLEWIKAQPKEWAQLENGAWIRRSPDQRRSVNEGQQVCLRMQVFNLSGKALYDCERSIIVGKEEGIPAAVCEVLQEGLLTDSTTLVCPWYVGFGPHGNGTVAPYENIMIKIHIK